jgi:integrase
LSQAEIAHLSEALAAYPNKVVANACRFLLLTGARRGEVLKMKWADVDLEAGVWVKPANTTKSKKPHRVPLSAGALEVLASLERTNDFVFPGRKTDRSLCDLKNAWEKIRAEAGLEDVRLHDLRHSYASILASAGLSLPIIGQLLGHTQPATTARYAHLFDEPLREATEKVAAHVTSASKPKAEVVKLRR